jgi:hypothetical protein
LWAVATANGDFVFGEPTNLGVPVNDSYGVRGACISRDGLSLYFSSNRPGGYGGYDLWVATRDSMDGNWGDPVNLGQPVNTAYDAWDPSISSEGLSLYFADGFYEPFMPGGRGMMDLWVATRDTVSEPFGAPVNLGPKFNNGGPNEYPCISADGLSLYFSGWFSNSLGLCDLWVSTRTSADDEWHTPAHLENVNSPFGEGAPDISVDGRVLFFISTRPRDFTTVDDFELWMAMRETTAEAFGAPVKLPPRVNTEPYSALFPSLSPDGSLLYFCSDRPGGFGDSDIWQVAMTPTVDFNGDGKVGGGDIYAMVDCWGADDPVCDVGPMPWGDGVVDVEDLKVLARYIGRELDDPTLIAHWALDEVVGTIARDGVGQNDGTVTGDAAWQPEGGMVGGALQFDGADDCVLTDLILDPDGGTFSILAWIKGGAPGQVIVSQADGKLGRVNYPGCSWLGIDAAGGLTTDLMSSESVSVASEVITTDGHWHRVALVWDDSSKTSALYVDGVEVSTYVRPTLTDMHGDLQIGIGRSGAPGSFFSGLIDDVRIYNRAVRP